jgi:Zn-dependent protease with chaperone function
MDSATRNLLGLLCVSITLTAYVLCGFVAYILVPFMAAADRPPLAGTLAGAAVATLLVAAATRASAVAGGQVRAARRLATQVEACAGPIPSRLRQAAAEMDLGGRVEVIESRAPFSFVYGLLEPRVAISLGLLKVLDEDELRAALAHERYHVRKLDPLRAMVGATLVRAFFLLPFCAALRDRYLEGRELAADRAARRVCGARPLGGALLKAVEGPIWREPSASAPLGGRDLLAARIEQLETGLAPRTHTNLSGLGTSALGAVAFTCLFGAAIAGIGGVASIPAAAAREFSVGGTVLGGACLAPLVLAVALTYRRLARRAGRPLAVAGRR